VIEREIERQPSIIAAAQALGLSEGYLYPLIRKMGIKSRRESKSRAIPA
jgi:hypothetical protein